MTTSQEQQTPRGTHRAPSMLHRVVRAERQRARQRARRGLGWRLVTPAVFVGAGLLIATSGVNSGGTDLRPGRYADLADLATEQSQRVQELRADITTLNSQIDELTAGVANQELGRLKSQIASLELDAGVAAVEGPGVTVTLDDAPREVLASAGEQVNNAVVHQQDIQAVVNALWAGGAEAMTIQGQRIVSTTGIKCIGNTVRLQDVPYSPPYVISAVGNPETMIASIDTNPYIEAYLQAVDQWELGWDVQQEKSIVAPEYTGPLEMRYARPAGQVQDDGT